LYGAAENSERPQIQADVFWYCVIQFELEIEEITVMIMLNTRIKEAPG
jgi:hypothetical protein